MNDLGAKPRLADKVSAAYRGQPGARHAGNSGQVRKSAVLTGSHGMKTLPWSPGKTEILRAVEALTERGFHARYEETARGFLSLRGGHRLGLCGQMGSGGFEEVSGFCLRLAGQWPGAADEVIRALATKPVSLLVIGPPGSGKTTLLRDLCRQWSLAGVQDQQARSFYTH